MHVLKIPYEGGRLRSPPGAAAAPDAIEEALTKYTLTEAGDQVDVAFDEVDVDNTRIDASHDAIRHVIQETGPSRILGGDHSITKPAVQGFARREERPGLVVFDAHVDAMDSQDTHEDYLRGIVGSGAVAPEDIMLVGVRRWHEQERSFLEEEGIQFFSMRDISRSSVADVCDTVMMNGRRCTALYISIDIDVLDPAFAPGTGYPEPGGLTTRELLYFVQRVSSVDGTKAVDLVEVNPEQDQEGTTVAAAAHVLVETL